MDGLFGFVKNIYHQNRMVPLFFRRRDPLIARLFQQTQKYVPKHTQFYQYVLHVAKYNNNRFIRFSKNNDFFKTLYRESVKLSQKSQKIDPPIRKENIKTPDPEKKAALLIGINYKGTDAELRGCENDIENTKRILIEKYGFNPREIIVLKESLGVRGQPTRNNILRFMRWLANKSNSGYGTVWFQYSGHGTYIKDTTGDEKDGKDECIYTCDDNLIVDDEFHKELVSRIHKESKLFCFMDCCHSGSIMDLKYKYQAGKNKSVSENSKKAALANVLALSGCKDDQTSADAWLSGDWCGALTKTFLDVMKQSNYDITLFDMVNKIRNQLQKGGFTQIPQLTSSKDVLADTKFAL